MHFGFLLLDPSSAYDGDNMIKTTPMQNEELVSRPLVRDVDTRIGLLGQFSAIDRVELRAQVGGTLTEIHFQDGQIVHKGDLLFAIDPRPYGDPPLETAPDFEFEHVCKKHMLRSHL
jgi:hypothetical protein